MCPEELPSLKWNNSNQGGKKREINWDSEEISQADLIFMCLPVNQSIFNENTCYDEKNKH